MSTSRRPKSARSFGPNRSRRERRRGRPGWPSRLRKEARSQLATRRRKEKIAEPVGPTPGDPVVIVSETSLTGASAVIEMKETATDDPVMTEGRNPLGMRRRDTGDRGIGKPSGTTRLKTGRTTNGLRAGIMIVMSATDALKTETPGLID
jgi:hypothetical protein